MMADALMGVLHDALRGLALRQRTIADNVANVQTPGFLAGRVDFERDLGEALRSGGDQPASAEPVVSRSLAPTRTDGNNVDLDAETLSLVDTNLRYQTMVEAMNAKFRLLRTAIGGS